MEQLLINDCIKFAFGTSCNLSCIWFLTENCVFILKLMAKTLQLSNAAKASKLPQYRENAAGQQQIIFLVKYYGMIFISITLTAYRSLDFC